ncbi:hypothetical protein AVEN_119189-1 [Araneus ventricosus]|uniref:Uncharacterized protein n=1 Tax=Araneus ventricosus TaxID=182803 RepID=A0A4Y2UEC6_ARAVE|nr:hypothetical protein AVEN_240401-1 [Araneus ventricosus]GBO11389.1 hypothetical protein AVEN_119189-1 [Araneus ventricosus]
MSNPYEKDIELLRKLLAEVETDEDSDFDKEDNGPEEVLEENFSDHEIFSEHATKSEKGGDSENEEVNNSKWFASNCGVQNRTPSLTPVPVTRPVTERFHGQDTEILFKKKRKTK